MKQKPFTQEQMRAFDRQGDTSEMEAGQIKIVAKFFNPCGAGTWYVYDYDRDPESLQPDGTPDRLWAFCVLDDPALAECGTVSLSEMQSIRLRAGLTIERDIHFPVLGKTLEEVTEKIKSGGHV